MKRCFAKRRTGDETKSPSENTKEHSVEKKDRKSLTLGTKKPMVCKNFTNLTIPTFGFDGETKPFVPSLKRDFPPKRSTKRNNETIEEHYCGPYTVKREFSLHMSTEWFNKTEEQIFVGPYAHIRKKMDYSYHSNYIKRRQWLQDSIIEKFMRELVRTKACNEIDVLASSPNTPDILKNGIGTDVWAIPKEPWLIMVAGEHEIAKRTAINFLLQKDRLPVMGFVLVDPREIRMLLPEYAHIEQKDLHLAEELTRKETGYIIEILTRAAIEAGTNVVVYGHLSDVSWYQQYCESLKNEFEHLRVAILHIFNEGDGDESVKAFDTLVTKIDYFCNLKMFSDLNKDIEILTDGITWDSFTKRWQQSSAWFQETQKKKILAPILHHHNLPKKTGIATWFRPRSTKDMMTKESLKHGGKCSKLQFSIKKSTEEIYESNDMHFYGPYAHVRKTLDYSYHSNYTRERQILQDAIISDFMKKPKVMDTKGQVCSTPTEPFIVFTAGAMGAGKSHVLRYMHENRYFPLSSFVIVDPDEIRNHFPEYNIYKCEAPMRAGEMTRKEAGYIVEILTQASMQAGLNVLVDGSLRDWRWYERYFAQLKKDHPSVKISILHVDAPRDSIIERARQRGIVTGRKIPVETLDMAIKQVPISVAKLKNDVDSYYKFNNIDGSNVELVTEKCTWESFTKEWVQECAWIPSKKIEKSGTITSCRAVVG